MDIVIVKSNQIHSKYRVEGLKEKQSDCLVASQSSDVLAILPTGYGKTIIIQCLPFLEEVDRLVVIVSPLNTIIAEQAARFGQFCRVIDNDFLVDHLASDKDSEKAANDIIDSNVLYLLGHPEQITSMKMQKFLMEDSITRKVKNQAAPFGGKGFLDLVCLCYPSSLEK